MSHSCEHCSKEFDSYNSLKQHKDASHSQPVAQPADRKVIKIQWYVPVLIIILVVALAAWHFWPASPAMEGPVNGNSTYWTEPFPFGRDPTLHWHAYPKFNLCGQEETLLDIMRTAGVKFPSLDSESMVGPEGLHTHLGEPWIHIESPPPNRAAITLGQFFKNINVKFSNSGILTYAGTNGCNNNQTNSMKVTADGKSVVDPANLVLQDGQKILISYS